MIRVGEGLDGDRLSRAMASRRSSGDARSWLDAAGLLTATADAIGLGVVEGRGGLGGAPLEVVFPLRRRDGGRGLLVVATSGDGLAPGDGQSGEHWSTAFDPRRTLLALPDLLTFWLVEQALGGSFDPFVAVAPTPGRGMPAAWAHAGFWDGAEDVSVLVDDVVSAALPPDVVDALGPDATVLPTPTGAPWRRWLGDGGALDAGRLRAMAATAPRVSTLRSGAVGGARVDLERVDLRELDREGRLCRLIAVEERSWDGGRRRVRDLVVRSDGTLLDLIRPAAPVGAAASERLVALSDGTILERPPSAGMRCAWSLASVRRFVAGGEGRGIAEITGGLLRDLAAEIAASAGVAEPDAARLAAFVLSTFVHQAFDELRVAVVAVADDGGRLALLRTMTALCHAGRSVGRMRARALARIADEGGGTILMDCPGPLSAVGGPTETGRFLQAGCMRGLSMEHAVEADGLRPLRTFGPKLVLVPSFEPHRLPVEWRVAPAAGADRRRMDERARHALVDRSYEWAMRAVAEIVAVGHSGMMPVDAVALLAGTAVDDTPAAGGGGPGGDPGTAVARDPDGDMLAALSACRADGGDEVAMTRLQMELALRGCVGDAFSPERIGRWLAASGGLRPDAAVGRRRLFGHIARIYPLIAAAGAQDRSSDPLAFCVAGRCSECRYATVCDAVAPGLRRRRLSAGGMRDGG